jgi:hypothetical protein
MKNKRISTRAFSFISLGIGFGVFFTAMSLIRSRFGDDPGTDAHHYILVTILLSSSIASLPGLLFIKRREGPSHGFTHCVYGNKALVSAIIWLAILGSPALLVLYAYLEMFIGFVSR